MAECAAHAAGACFGRDGGALRRTRQGACRTGRRWGVSYFHRSDLLYTVSLTRAAIGQSVDIVLDNDLTLTEADLTVAKQYGGLIFGTIDLPFKGTFDGQGHTIKGLKYDRELFTPKANTGLFASTDGAIIKNLTLEDAYIGADFRGGVLVGRADNTRIENVTLINCTSSITPANNAVSLITKPACWAASSPARRTEASSTTARCAAAGACRTRRPPSPRWAAKGCTWARW